MNTTKKLSRLSLLALCSALAIPTLASAEHRDRWMKLGEVGTHRHDGEDYVQVHTHERFESLELTTEGRPVRFDGVLVQYQDGREYRADVNWVIRPGERVMIDVPAYSPIKMLVLEYDNPGRHFRAREDARVEVRGLTVDRDDRRYQRERRDDDRRRYEPRDRRTDRRHDDRRDHDHRFEWRGGLYVRIR